MISLIRTDSSNRDFVSLVAKLDADLAIRDGEDHAFYDQFNKLDQIKHVVLVLKDAIPIGCGAIKMFDNLTMEIKRMYTLPEERGQGVASKTLSELEHWAAELDFTYCVLETGINQPEAIALYEKNGYRRTKNYGQYVGVEASFCFRKRVKPPSINSN